MATDWRLDVRLKSKELLVGLMAVHGLSVRDLAKLCDPKEPTRHRSAIGHLCSGKRNTCSPKLAERIQEVVGNPKAVLFEPTVSRVARDGAREGSAA